MNTYKITIPNYEMEFEALSGESLLNALAKSGINIPAYCAGKGICGKCKVRFLNTIPNPTRAEERLLSDDEIKKGIRLACQHFVNSNISLEISEKFNFDVFIRTNPRYEKKSNLLGIAVDLGTTTICMRIVDLLSRDWILETMSLNPLIPFGSDVVSRMTWVIEKNKGDFFSKLLFKKISAILGSCISKLHHKYKTKRMVIVGNNPMMHLLLNLDVSSLALAPYESPYLHEMLKINSREYDFDGDFDIVIPPSIGGFIGSDFLMVLYSLKDSLNDCGVVADLGTNGEIGIWDRDQILVTSTAAGPAFEGMKITHGMVAIDGAIESFKIIGDNFNIKTIGNVEPKGICGSGLIDILSEFIKSNFIHEDGRINPEFADEDNRIPVFTYSVNPIYLYQKDVREIQLSKAAVSAAFKVLIKHLRLTTNDIQKFFLAGNFGNGINIENAINIGLLPQIAKRRFKLIGNAALKGAIKFCIDEKAGIDFFENMLKRLRHIRLEDDEKFFETFIGMMSFKPEGE